MPGNQLFQFHRNESIETIKTLASNKLATLFKNKTRIIPTVRFVRKFLASAICAVNKKRVVHKNQPCFPKRRNTIDEQFIVLDSSLVIVGPLPTLNKPNSILNFGMSCRFEEVDTEKDGFFKPSMKNCPLTH